MTGEGMRLRSVVGWMACAFLGAALLLAHVWRQNAYVRWSRDLFVADRHIDQVRNDIALLETEIDFLSRRSRLETIAREKFGMSESVSPIPVYADERWARNASTAKPRSTQPDSDAASDATADADAPRAAGFRMIGFASDWFGGGEGP